MDKKMEQNMQVMCKRCSSKVPLSKMRYDKSGNNLICGECYVKLYTPSVEEEKPAVYQSAVSNRVKYNCLSCGFKFSRAEGFSFGGKCFNCGKQTVQREDTKSVMVKDSKNLLD